MFQVTLKYLYRYGDVNESLVKHLPNSMQSILKEADIQSCVFEHPKLTRRPVVGVGGIYLVKSQRPNRFS